MKVFRESSEALLQTVSEGDGQWQGTRAGTVGRARVCTEWGREMRTAWKRRIFGALLSRCGDGREVGSCGLPRNATPQSTHSQGQGTTADYYFARRTYWRSNRGAAQLSGGQERVGTGGLAERLRRGIFLTYYVHISWTLTLAKRSGPWVVRSGGRLKDAVSLESCSRARNQPRGPCPLRCSSFTTSYLVVALVCPRRRPLLAPRHCHVGSSGNSSSSSSSSSDRQQPTATDSDRQRHRQQILQT